MSLELPRIIVALDFDDIETTRQFVQQLDPKLCRLKVGNILFTKYGPALIEELISQGFSIFLDLKFHDIPQTVAGACRSAAELGVWMINVHVTGGRAMLEAAVNAVSQCANKPLLIGVTVLTSLEDEDIELLGIRDSVQNMVSRFAKLAYQTGLDGVVCSAKEAPFLRGELPKDFLLVTPGIRVAGNEGQDQKRIMTPEAAVHAGSDYLVMGRSVTQVEDPVKVLQEVTASIS